MHLEKNLHLGKNLDSSLLLKKPKRYGSYYNIHALKFVIDQTQYITALFQNVSRGRGTYIKRLYVIKSTFYEFINTARHLNSRFCYEIGKIFSAKHAFISSCRSLGTGLSVTCYPGSPYS